MPKGYSLASVRRLRKELRDIKAEYGLITKGNVVEWARAHPESRLHREFDWDDDSAAEKYRLAQAGEVLRGLKVYVALDGPTEERKPIRVYVSVVKDGGRRYEETVTVMKTAALRDRLLDELRESVETLVRKYETYQSLTGRVVLLRNVLRELDRQEQEEEVPV